MDGWMDGSLSCPLFSSSSCLFSAAGALAPAASGTQLSPQSASISMALCVNVPWGLGPAQTPAEPISAPDHHRRGLSLPLLCLSPSIMQPIVPSCSPHISLFTPTFAALACPLTPRVGFSCSLTHSDTQSAMSQSSWTTAHSSRTHKTATRVLCYWSDRLNWVLIEFRYIFIIADNHYTRYLQSLWNITIGIYRNFVQNMPDFNAWIVGSLFSHFWRTKHWPKSHWCLEVL